MSADNEHASRAAATTAPARFEHLERVERWWLRVGIALLIVFVSIVFIDALFNSAEHSHGDTVIDPTKVSQTAPFDKPGVFRNKDGSYDAVVVAYTFGFLPTTDLVVPHGKTIHFKVTSLDVVHGYQIPGVSNVNLEVLPGHVSEVAQVFDKPGRHLILCHQYCGSGHHFMAAHIRVLKPGETSDAPDNPNADHAHTEESA
jgi:cytochrome c oxidase subunit 2